jgi:hypothetical protein
MPTSRRFNRNRPIEERNREILQMRKRGVPRREVALAFGLSRARISKIEEQDATDASMAERGARLREEIRNADDPERLWPVSDLLNVLGLVTVTKKRLLEHFEQTGNRQVSLRALIDMCVDGPVAGLDFMMPPLLRVYGVGKKGFHSVINGLTALELGSRCNAEWQIRLSKVRKKYGV